MESWSIILIIAAVGVFIVGAGTIIYGLTKFDLLDFIYQSIFALPLRTVAYIYLLIISSLALLNLARLIDEEKNERRKSGLYLAVLIGLMLCYSLVSFGHSFITSTSYKFSMLQTVISLVVAFIFGGFLPFICSRKPYGTFIYILLITNLIAFTWLARFSDLNELNWIAFSVVLGYFGKESINLLRDQPQT